MAKKSKKPKKNPIVCVTWLDAMGQLKADKSDIDRASPKSFLIVNKTYGILYKKDDFAVIILQEDSDDQVDYTVVPKSLITEIKVLK
jgi:hypothetical protein